MNLKFLISAIRPMLPELKNKLDPAISEMLAKVALEEDEEKAVYMLHLSNDDHKAYISTVLLDSNDRIVRVESNRPATDFLISILEQI